MKYIITEDKYISNYIGGASNYDVNLTCNQLFSLQNITCVEVGDQLFNVLRAEWLHKIIEIDREMAEDGSIFFSEIRPYGKTIAAGGTTPQATPEWQKIEVPMDEARTKRVMDFMKLFAKEIIEDEFERRFLVLKDASTLEVESWAMQRHEAQEYLSDPINSRTPLLDYIASERRLDKNALAVKILQKSEEYQDSLSEMLVKMQKLIKEFENATSIWDLNVLFEDYLGVMMPTKQAVEMGRTISKDDWTRTDHAKAGIYNF